MLSKTGIHAVRALAALANLPEGDYAGAASLAREIGAPQNYLGKLLQQLARGGIVVSQKGLGGGFRLARPAKRISLFDAVDPFDQIGRWDGCLLGNPTCSARNACSVHERWGPLRDRYLAFLREVTIADVAGVGKGPKRGR
jgi:Rrf2 family protein